MSGAILEHTVKVIVEDALAMGGQLRVRIAEIARSQVAELVRSGRAPPNYRVFVDGVEGAREESVRIPGGTIHYVFSRLAEAVVFAIAQAILYSPQGEPSPHYADTWFVFVNGQPWTRSLAELPPGVEVGITNSRPYHRKIDVGGQQTSVPPQIIERVRQRVAAKYPELFTVRTFVTWPGAYVLKGHAIRSGLSYDFKLRRFVRKHPPRPTRRSDTRAGQVMTYPTLIIREVR